MLLTIDIGNTNVTLGVFKGRNLLHTWRFETYPQKPANRRLASLRSLLKKRGLSGAIHCAAIGSVVPKLTPTFRKIAQKISGRPPLLITPKTPLGLKLAVDFPSQVGADRILNALAAYRTYGGPCIVLDFGTATTFDCISEKGYYLGGAILIGPKLAAEALADKTAKLPLVGLQKPKRVIGKNTIECIQAGLFYGYLGMVQKVLEMTQKEMKATCTLLATGGLAGIFAPYLPKIRHIPDLTLQGLRIAYETAYCE